MEAKKVRSVAAIMVVGLVVLLVILWLTLRLSKTFFLIAGIDFAVILAVFIWVLVRHLAVDRRRKSMARRAVLEGEELRLEYSSLRKVAGLPAKFRYEALEAATDNFQSLLGQGSSGSVFKGILDDGTAVAVKRIDGGGEYGDREFRSEVSAIATAHHVNLVRLLGYCIVPRGLRFLVYEFVPNGSLDRWIFPSAGRRGCLPWPARYRAAIDVGKALAYLHHDCRSRVLHLDVKPENILLDEGFRALVTDFGLSKLMGRDESRVVTTVRGTRGYLAPEWFLESGISVKCDVFSYGMVVLEMVGGRRSVERRDGKWSYFPKIVIERVREGRVMEVVDERVRAGGVEEGEVRRMVYVALWCIQERTKLRPSMAGVVDMLEGRTPVEAPPETEMLVLDFLADEDVSPVGPSRVDGHDQPMASTNSYEMSTLMGR